MTSLGFERAGLGREKIMPGYRDMVDAIYEKAGTINYNRLEVDFKLLLAPRSNFRAGELLVMEMEMEVSGG